MTPAALHVTLVVIGVFHIAACIDRRLRHVRMKFSPLCIALAVWAGVLLVS